METLDPRTIMLMTTLMCAAMTIVMFSVYQSFRREVDGLGHWSAGLLLLVCASVLFGTRLDLSVENLSNAFDPTVGVLNALLGANASLLLGIGLSMLGTEKFYGQKPACAFMRWPASLARPAWPGGCWWTRTFPCAWRFFR